MYSMEQQTDISKAKWMEGLFDVIKDRKLNQIVFPGTHDSGTYNLTKQIAPDAEPIVKQLWGYKMDGTFNLEDFILGWAKSQSFNIYSQLQQGIRYIDLRICSVNNDFFTCHSLIGDHISIMLSHIIKFLNENTSELVYIKVGFKFDNFDGDKKSEIKEKAKKFLSDTMGSLFNTADKELMNITFEEICKSGKRAIFDYDDFINGNYPNTDKNSEAVDYLKKLPESKIDANGEVRDWAVLNNGSLFEIQFQLTAQERMFVESFLQKNGCRLLPFIPALMAVPVFGPVLTALGITGLAAYMAYLKECSPVPTSLSELADSSRTVIRDFFEWYTRGVTLDGKAIQKLPNLFISDFFERVPIVDIAISLNKYKDSSDLGSQVNALISAINNQWKPAFSIGDSLASLLSCSKDAIAALLYAAKYTATQAAQALKAGYEYSKDELAKLLADTGYPADEVGKALKDVLGLPYDVIGDALEVVGYPSQQIASAFLAMNVGAEDSIKYFRGKVDDKELESLLETAGYPKEEIGAALKAICGCILNVCSCVTNVCGCVTKIICDCVTKKICKCVFKCIHVKKQD